MSFQISLSGLNAASSDLSVTGNNIANASTTGFKGSRAEFADVYAVAYGGISSTAIGGGVRLAAVSQLFSQGNVNFTGNSLDLAINGRGFFVVEDASGRAYSRAGAFRVDRDGYVVNAQNQRLQVFPASSDDGSSFNTGSLSDLQLITTEGPPNASTQVDTNLNLKADAENLGAGVIDPDDPTTYSYSTSVTTYDSLGSSHTTTMYYRKTADNTWDVQARIDGDLVQSGGADQVELVFAPDGTLSTPADGLVAYDPYTPSTGADDMTLTFDYSTSTQYGSNFAVNGLSQDGYTTGRLSGIDIDENGIVSARYTNGQSQALGKVALADFPNPQGLRQLGDTAWAETFSAGDVLFGEAGSGSFGLVQSGALEASNVDIAAELVNLITAQRNFQANAQAISTQETVTQTIINI